MGFACRGWTSKGNGHCWLKSEEPPAPPVRALDAPPGSGKCSVDIPLGDGVAVAAASDQCVMSGWRSLESAANFAEKAVAGQHPGAVAAVAAVAGSVAVSAVSTSAAAANVGGVGGGGGGFKTLTPANVYDPGNGGKPFRKFDTIPISGSCAAGIDLYAAADLTGGDLGHGEMRLAPDAINQCCEACVSNSGCTSFTWLTNPRRDESHCYMKGMRPPQVRASVGEKAVYFGWIVSGVPTGMFATQPFVRPAPPNPRMDPTGKAKLYVSVTTVPPRVPLLHHTLRSILAQTVKPDVIFVALPKKCLSPRFAGQEYVLSPELAEMQVGLRCTVDVCSACAVCSD